jgi:hypothetical protein
LIFLRTKNRLLSGLIEINRSMDEGCVIREYRQPNVLARLEQPLAVPATNTKTAGCLLAQKRTPTETHNQITLHPPPNVKETRCPQIALKKDTFPSLTYNEYKALGLPRPNPAIKVNVVFWETISKDMYTLELFNHILSKRFPYPTVIVTSIVLPLYAVFRGTV